MLVIAMLVLLGLAILPTSIGWITLGMTEDVRSDLAAGILTGAVVGYALMTYEERQQHRRQDAEEQRTENARTVTAGIINTYLGRVATAVTICVKDALVTWWPLHLAEASASGTSANQVSVFDIHGTEWQDSDVVILGHLLSDVTTSGTGITNRSNTWLLLIESASGILASNDVPAVRPDSRGAVHVDTTLDRAVSIADELIEAFLGKDEPIRARQLLDLVEGLQDDWAARDSNQMWAPSILGRILSYSEQRQASFEDAYAAVKRSTWNDDWWFDPGTRHDWLYRTRQQALGGPVALSKREDPERKRMLRAADDTDPG